MELKEDMYVRTDLGISKINTIRKETIGTFVGTNNRKGNIHYGNEFVGYLIVDKTEEDKQWNKDHIKNNIIDLIEVGDYVNGGQVREKTKEYIRISGGKYLWEYLEKEEDIKSIVTKEQFSQMEYKVDDAKWN